MIRINLIAPERTPQKKAKQPSAPGAFQFYLLLFLLGGGALGGCGFLWWIKSVQIKDLDAKIQTAEKRQQELQVIKQQVDALERKRDMWKRQTELIERLQGEQSGPVHLLDELSKALPDFVWLRSMDQGGNVITLAGQASTMPAVADFMTALQKSGWFQQVELSGMTVDPSGLVTFGLRANFVNQDVVAKQKAQAAALAAAGASARPGGN